MAFWERRIGAGRGPKPGTAKAEKHGLERSLLRLTLAAIEIASTRREALEATATQRTSKLPHKLDSYRHNVFETTVVYELSQLTREYFAATGKTPVWERPVAKAKLDTKDPSGYSASVQLIDLAALETDATGDPEIRIEFGIHRDNGEAVKKSNSASVKVNADSAKLWNLRSDVLTNRNEAKALAKADDEAKKVAKGDSADSDDPDLTINYVILWHELRTDGTRASGAKLTTHRLDAWQHDSVSWATEATKHVNAQYPDDPAVVKCEAIAGTHLLTPVKGHHRAAVAALFSVSKAV